MPCLVNRKQLWTHRIMLESRLNDYNSFVTLTYDDDNIPVNHRGIPNLEPDDLQNFLKRLRYYYDKKIRYYAVGEYGTAGTRGLNPHFHLCIFGMGEEKGNLVQKAWQERGFTLTGTLTAQSAAYVAGYVQKKTQYNKDMYSEFEITPEFSRMSNRPGIGYGVVKKIADICRKDPDVLTPAGDVPIVLKHGKRTLPLGRYLREKIRIELDMDRTETDIICEKTGEVTERIYWHAKELQKEVYKAELQDMQKDAKSNPKIHQDATSSLKKLIQEKHKQDYIKFDFKQDLLRKEKVL